MTESRTPYATKLILHAPPWDDPSLAEFLEECVRDGVQLICVMGPGCERVHDVIDELLVIGDHPGILTAWHTDESLEEVQAFARSCSIGEFGEGAQEVTLRSR